MPARTLSLIADLSDEQLVCPRLPLVNSLLWEIGHVAWFQEKWLLRHLRRLGFTVWWPSWVMSSVPLPGLDRFMPTRPAQVL